MSIAPDRVTVSQRGEDLVARFLSPQLNEPDVAQEISERLQAALESCPQSVKSVHLDLGGVRSIASLALNHLLDFHAKAAGQGIDVQITDVQPAVREVLAITRLDRMFRLAEEGPALDGD
jgi:anti-anti-sigma factor